MIRVLPAGPQAASSVVLATSNGTANFFSVKT
jgi:hypothetical protein